MRKLVCCFNSYLGSQDANLRIMIYTVLYTIYPWPVFIRYSIHGRVFFIWFVQNANQFECLGIREQKLKKI